MQKPAPDIPSTPVQPSLRRRTVIDTARELGLLGGKNGRIGGRKYALAKVALEDDFGTKLFRRKGRIAQDLDLEL